MIRPLDDRLVIKPIEPEPLPSGIWTPPEKSEYVYSVAGSMRVMPTRGSVVRMGRRCKGGYKVGSVVRFSDSCARPFESDGQPYLFIREDDVIGVEHE